MKTTISPTRDLQGRFCFEWFILSASGEFLFGGYQRTKADALTECAKYAARVTA